MIQKIDGEWCVRTWAGGYEPWWMLDYVVVGWVRVLWRRWFRGED